MAEPSAAFAAGAWGAEASGALVRAALSSLSEDAPAPKSDAARFWPLAMWAVSAAAWV